MFEADGHHQGTDGNKEGVEAAGYVGRGGNAYGEYEFAAERVQAMVFRIPACAEV